MQISRPSTSFNGSTSSPGRPSTPKPTTLDQIAAYKDTPLELSELTAEIPSIEKELEHLSINQTLSPPLPKLKQYSTTSAKISRGKIGKNSLQNSLETIIKALVDLDDSKTGVAFDQWKSSKARHKTDKSELPRTQSELEFKQQFSSLSASQIATMDPILVEKTLAGFVKSERAYNKWTRMKNHERQNGIDEINNDKMQREELRIQMAKTNDFAKQRKSDELKRWTLKKKEEEELKKKQSMLLHKLETKKIAEKKSKVF
jgi:hypothetical protein